MDSPNPYMVTPTGEHFQMGQGHYVVASGGPVPPPPPPMPAPVPPSSAPISVSSQQLNSFDPSSMDANAAHVELTNSLLCGRLGEQCEAIVRFPRLFERYPFPILINSALLKLADVFRQHSNFVKLCVLRVIQQSERHLDKITMVDEFLKRIFTVLHSNDPVARALTLRTLGAVSVIIPERKQVHHNIRSALESHDNVEMHAAIFAAARFAARSKTFAVNMCSKISDMIKGYATPLDMKLRLIPIFQHMHHDAQTAAAVRSTCVEMLPAYPAEDFVVVTLRTLTQLAAHALVDIPEQVELLIGYLHDDARFAVKRRALADLRYLASADRAHLWSEANVAAVIAFARKDSAAASGAGAVAPAKGSSTSTGATLCGALSVLCDIVEHTSVEKLYLDSAECPVAKLCQSCCYSSSLPVAARATQLLTLLAVQCAKDSHHVDGMDVVGESVMSIEALFLLLSDGGGAKAVRANLGPLKECLQCVVRLCRVQPEACDQFVDIIGGMLHTGEESLSLLCEVLSALGNTKPGVLKPILHDICNAMASVAQGGDSMVVGGSEGEGEAGEAAKKRVLTLLAAMLFQTLKGHRWTPEAEQAVRETATAVDAWNVFRIARSAARYGHFGQAGELFAAAATAVSTEQMYFWLTGLSQVCRGEHALTAEGDEGDIVDRLAKANSDILLGISSITAATTQYKNHDFQISYLKCRSEMLHSLSQLAFACNSLRTSPPPAIASAQAKQAHDDLQRCGRVTSLLRAAVSNFSEVARMFSDLYTASFDADADTLARLQLLRQLNSCLSQWIEMVCLKSSLQGTMYQDQTGIDFAPNLPKPREEHGIEVQSLVSMGERVAALFHRLFADPEAPRPITDRHTQCLLAALSTLSALPVGLPRFFFQSLQATSVKLSVTPQPRAGGGAGDPVAVSAAQQLAVKVEGVITSSSLASSSPPRAVKAVHLSLQSTLLTPAKSASASATEKPQSSSASDSPLSLENLSVPHNDFFTAQFLVTFPTAGSYQVAIDTQLVDDEERFWKSGQRPVIVNIKAFEDPRAAGRANR